MTNVKREGFQCKSHHNVQCSSHDFVRAGANSEKDIFTHDYLYQKGHLIYML